MNRSVQSRAIRSKVRWRMVFTSPIDLHGQHMRVALLRYELCRRREKCVQLNRKASPGDTTNSRF